MNEQGHAQLGHGFEDRVEDLKVPNPGVGVGGGAGWVELHRGHKTRFPALAQVLRVGGFREVKGHERLEGLAWRNR